MGKLSIAPTKDYFLKDGKPFFYMADTVWGAFISATLEEWEEYLKYRRMQGFNALRISVLGIWNDRSIHEWDILPYELTEKGKCDFSRINDNYFDKAEKMLEIAVNYGFIPDLTLLWLCFVKDTQSIPYDEEWVMPLELVKPYTEYVVRRFAKYDPVYCISGDTNFPTAASIAYYMTALETVKALAPEALTTMHIAGNQPILHEAFVKSPLLDFYMYQSGHNPNEQYNAYKYAENFCRLPEKRPVLNGEPCYEGINRGAFKEFEVRRALWQSLLAGAKCGFTYGAHGIWMWHRSSSRYINEAWCGRPFDWRTAVRLGGAWEVAFARYVFETYQLFDIEPAGLIRNQTEEIRLSISRDMSRIVLYTPVNTDIQLEMDLSGYEWILIELSQKRFVRPVIELQENICVIRRHDFNSDVLILGIKQAHAV